MRLARFFTMIAFALVPALSASAIAAEGSPVPVHNAESTVTTTVPPSSTTTTTLDNPFIPEDVNLSDCISGVPRPGCGSEARGGWRQALVFVALLAGIALVVARIAFGMARKGRRRGDAAS